MFTVNWIRGPDCQCDACQSWKGMYVLPLRAFRGTLQGYSYRRMDGRTGPFPQELEELLASARRELNELSAIYPADRSSHLNMQYHFLHWVTDELFFAHQEAIENPNSPSL